MQFPVRQGATHLPDVLDQLLLALLFESPQAFFAAHADNAACTTLECLSERLHPPQNLSDAVIKSLIVVGISVLWFKSFVLAHRYRVWHKLVISDRHRSRSALGLSWPPGPTFMTVVIIFASLVAPSMFAMAMHEAYVADIRRKHARKVSFWAYVNGKRQVDSSEHRHDEAEEGEE